MISDKERDLLEKSTRGQANNSAWKELRKGRITASVCHDVFTNVSNTAKKRIPPFPKTLTLVAKLISRDKDYLPLHGLLKMKKMV